ncbi:MAG: transposase [Chloroflexi bacterium]|nr:transposase [Chloroflexota bacterium]
MSHRNRASLPTPYLTAGMVYQPNAIKGNKPVTIGHQFSTTVLLPEAEEGLSPSWVIPLMTSRVSTDEDKELVGSRQINALLKDPKLPFGKRFCVDVGDTSYSKPACLHANRHHRDLVSVARIRGTRVLYRQFVPNSNETKRPVGCPRRYGERFALQEPETWHQPDEHVTVMESSRRGKTYRIEIKAWHNMLMPGKRKPKRLPMHRHPFTLVQVIRYDEEGNLACKRPMWLLAIGKRRHELSAQDIYEAYGQRYDLEHFSVLANKKCCWRVSKHQRMYAKKNGGRWCIWPMLNYGWRGMLLAVYLKPWERNLPAMKKGLMSPTLVQRDFGRIIRQIGTPAKPPKPRFISPGRPKGNEIAPSTP